MRFCANISMLFVEAPLLERFGLARSAGFDTVELWWPSGHDVKDVVAAIRAADVDVAVLNFAAGDMPAGDRGLISDPARRADFRANVPVALELAAAVGATKLNALAGHRIDSLTLDEQLALARDNVRFAADHAAEIGAEILIEAVNTIENGPYLLATTPAAADFVAMVARPNVRLQYDAYHMQRMGEDLGATIERHLAQIGHIQIADAPGRGEPGTGEIDYTHLLAHIEALGYDGFIGLEYKPSGGDTEASLAWLPRAARAARRPVVSPS
ncbi:MAG: TIM barrel protein [Solirubrobacteraceae bacterium]